MLKRIAILALSTLLFPLSSYANGFYAGVGIGRDTANFDQKLTINSTAFVADNDANGSGALGTVFAGYSWLFNKFYLASELNAALSSIDHHSYVSSTTVPAFTLNNRYAIANTVGISLLPGIKITDASLIYGRLGYVRSQLKIDSQINNSTTSDTHYLDGFRYGVGLETQFTRNLGLRLEYDHTDYQSYSLTTSVGGVNATASVKPKSDQGILSLVWYFA